MEVLSKQPSVKGPAEMFTGDLVEIRPGDVIYTPPGEWHWHGAAPHNFMTHIAMWEAPAEGPETEWGEHVGDAEYPNPA